MVRQGALATLIGILAACSPEVDDPANFTVGNTNGNSASGTATTGGGGDSTTEVADGSAGATSTTGGADTQGVVDSSSGGGPVDTGNVGNCGNGVIDAGEQCDGVDLQGFDCQSLGLNSGTLACDPMMCTFDTSMCSSSTGGTSG
jgi:hypothetical protein